VRLLKGNFDAETRYDLEPHELLQRYRALGASWLHVVDLDGAKDGRLANRSVIVRLASQRALHIQVGGGVRSAAVVDDLLRNGIDRVIVGSAAVESPAEVQSWLKKYGAEKIGLAFDVRHDAQGLPRVLTRGWTRESPLSLWDAIESYLPHGLQHVLCTDAELDGAMQGPAVGLYQDFTKRYPQLQLQASGGVRSAADLQTLADAGSAAAISGKALLEEAIKPAELRPFLPNASSPASTSATARS
jgi:phosphoribosylformimino-5-aminoimidazole carboxamide ribotide isomerase